MSETDERLSREGAQKEHGGVLSYEDAFLAGYREAEYAAQRDAGEYVAREFDARAGGMRGALYDAYMAGFRSGYCRGYREGGAAEAARLGLGDSGPPPPERAEGGEG